MIISGRIYFQVHTVKNPILSLWRRTRHSAGISSGGFLCILLAAVEAAYTNGAKMGHIDIGIPEN